MFPFKQGDVIIELGGGNNPQFHPNLDCRFGQGIDIVADFNRPLPVPDSSFDGVYCQFAIEHISWRKVEQFISECYRILKPGGTAFFITANLYEQAKKLAETQDWNSGMVCMIFGDNDYPQNTHRCGFSPRYAWKLFSKAGFYHVEVSPLPSCNTDMIIVARKGNPEIVIL